MQPNSEPDHNRSRRLESWKEIAAYLDRSVRTVRRWEGDERLPVHRHRHAKGSTVFAHSHELDQWRRGRVAERSQPPATASEPLPPPLATGNAHALRLVAVTAGLALVVAVVALLRSLSVSDPEERLDVWINSIPVEQRLLLEASYHRGRGAHEASLRAFEAALGTGAIGREAVTAALDSCRTLDATARCDQFILRAADRSPEDATLLAMASHVLAQSPDRLEEALQYAERSKASARLYSSAMEPELVSFVELLPARKAWLDGDIAASADHLDRVMREIDELRGGTLDAVAGAAGRHCLALGRIDCADRLFSRVADERRRHELQSYRLFAAGEIDAMRAHMAAVGGDYAEIETAILLAMSGQAAVAGELVDSLNQRRGLQGAAEVARGGLDLLAGHPMEAKPQLESGLSMLAEEGTGIHFIGLDMLSRIAEKRGEMERAVELLEMTSKQRENSILRGSGLFWIKCQTRLAEVYRSMDLTQEALRVERELLTALALADADHPTTSALRQRSV